MPSYRLEDQAIAVVFPADHPHRPWSPSRLFIRRVQGAHFQG